MSCYDMSEKENGSALRPLQVYSLFTVVRLHFALQEKFSLTQSLLRLALGIDSSITRVNDL